MMMMMMRRMRKHQGTTTTTTKNRSKQKTKNKKMKIKIEIVLVVFALAMQVFLLILPFAYNMDDPKEEKKKLLSSPMTMPNKKKKKKNRHHLRPTVKMHKTKTTTTTTMTMTEEESSSSCLDPNGPIPIVLVSFGRSGSSSIWDVLGNLTGEMTEVEEYTGQGSNSSTAFFENVVEKQRRRRQYDDDNYTTAYDNKDDDDVIGHWLLDKLCQQQREYPNAGLVGFKWKPNGVSFHHVAAIAGLKTMAKYGIKAIRSQRNELDVIISREKHAILDPIIMTQDGTHVAHCRQGDVTCKQLHLEMASKFGLDPNLLYTKLKQLKRQQQEVDELLETLHVPHVKVSYDKLYFEENAKEWIKLFDFIQKGSGNHLTKQDIENAMTFVSTSSRDQRLSINNFDDVANLLIGTEFEGLLRSESIPTTTTTTTRTGQKIDSTKQKKTTKRKSTSAHKE